MATGAGLGNLLPAAMALVGIVTILRNRARRRKGGEAPDSGQTDGLADRRAATLETERRMASYLASRDQRTWRDDDAQG